jgi:dienelactone hydrolase
MQKRWNRVGRKSAFSATSLPAWKAWRRRTVQTLKTLTGFDTMIPCALRPKITGEKIFDGYRRQRVEIQTEPGVIMPLFVLIPEGKQPFPVVIAPHGHGSGGKYAVADCREIPGLPETIDHYNYAYGVAFARAGFITFCPDARGFGERQETLARKGGILNQSCQWLNNMAYPLGQTVTGMWAWDLHRLVDYIQSRPDCRPDRIGCAGLSGGGLQTLWATAFDERIKCAVISGYLYGYKESLLDLHGNCSCNYVPHLYEHVDMGDIAALIAPRPLLIETGTQDGLNGASGLKNVASQFRIAKKAYRLLKAPDMLKQDIFEGPHRWNGVEALPWLKKHLGK